MTPISTLRARVEALEGPDREVDALIARHFGTSHGALTLTGCKPVEIAPRYTESVDAVLELMRQKAPGRSFSLEVDGYASSPALALLSALLSALEQPDAQEARD